MQKASTLTKACCFRYKKSISTDNFSDGDLIECVINEAGATPDDETFEKIVWFNPSTPSDQLDDSTIEALLEAGLATQDNIAKLQKKIEPLPKSKSKHNSSEDTHKKNVFYKNVIKKAKPTLPMPSLHGAKLYISIQNVPYLGGASIISDGQK